MADLKEQCRILVADALNAFGKELGVGDVTTAAALVMETPPNPDMGDVGIPLFPFAKSFRQAPPAIAAKVVALVQQQEGASGVGSFAAVGPYINVKLNKAAAICGILDKIASQKEQYGSLAEGGTKFLEGRRVMVEFSSPNTNKPLHLGHLRNDALGESISRILKAAGAAVFKVNIINNRGVHICKSMLAYQKFHQEKGETPESLGLKSDRFVGDCYVEFDKWNKEAFFTAQASASFKSFGDSGIERLFRLCCVIFEGGGFLLRQNTFNALAYPPRQIYRYHNGSSSDMTAVINLSKQTFKKISAPLPYGRGAKIWVLRLN